MDGYLFLVLKNLTIPVHNKGSQVYKVMVSSLIIMDFLLVLGLSVPTVNGRIDNTLRNK